MRENEVNTSPLIRRMKTMRNKILKYNNENSHLPEIGIIFCGNRAVVTSRYTNSSPKYHTQVYFGLFFWLRLKVACYRVFNLLIKENKNNE